MFELLKSWEQERLREKLEKFKERASRLAGSPAGDYFEKGLEITTRRLDILHEQERQGQYAERKFLHAVRKHEYCWPRWLTRIEKAPPYMDATQGTDVLVTTARGIVPLQIKSSDNFVETHRKKYPRVPWIVIKEKDSDGSVFQLFLTKIKTAMTEGHFITVAN